jgi:hypothetical protein
MDKDKVDKKMEKEREKIDKKFEKEFEKIEKIEKDRGKKETERETDLQKKIEKLEKDRDKEEKDKDKLERERKVLTERGILPSTHIMYSCYNCKDMRDAFRGQRTRLHELFSQIDKEFELLWEENNERN